MLSLFPQLLDWSFYVPFFFRLFVGIYLIVVGIRFTRARMREQNEQNQDAILYLGILLFLTGLFFIGGLFMQALGAIGFALALIALTLKQRKYPLVDESFSFYLLIGLVSLSFIFLGPGPFSFDLPL